MCLRPYSGNIETYIPSELILTSFCCQLLLYFRKFTKIRIKEKLS